MKNEFYAIMQASGAGLRNLEHFCCVNLQEMSSLQCSLHEVNKGEQTRVVVDSQVTQHGGSREFLIVQ